MEYSLKRSESESHSVMSDSLRPLGLYSPWNSSGQTTGVGSLSLLQRMFPTQGLNPSLPHCRQILYRLSHQGSPGVEWKTVWCSIDVISPSQCAADHSLPHGPWLYRWNVARPHPGRGLKCACLDDSASSASALHPERSTPPAATAPSTRALGWETDEAELNPSQPGAATMAGLLTQELTGGFSVCLF